MVYLWLFQYFWKYQHLNKLSLCDISIIAIQNIIKILKIVYNTIIVDKLYYCILCIKAIYYGKEVYIFQINFVLL